MAGLGVDHFVTIPPEGLDPVEFFARYPLPKGVAVIQTLTLLSYSDDFKIDFGAGPALDLPALDGHRIDPGEQVWFYSEIGMPFRADKVEDIRLVPAEEAVKFFGGY